MDRPRPPNACRPGDFGGFVRSALAVAACAVLAGGCAILTADFDRIIGIELDASARTVEVGDTVQLTARAINASGEAVADVAIFWSVLDTGLVGFALDTATGVITGQEPGSGRVQARIEGLSSDPVTVTVVAPPEPTPATGLAMTRGDLHMPRPRQRRGAPSRGTG